MTEDLIRRLMFAGLTKQQATSTTANTLVRLFMPEDGKMLLQEARQQVDEMKALVDKLKGEYNELKGRLDSLSATLIAVSEAQEQHGTVTDEKARNIMCIIELKLQPVIELTVEYENATLPFYSFYDRIALSVVRCRPDHGEEFHFQPHQAICRCHKRKAVRLLQELAIYE